MPEPRWNRVVNCYVICPNGQLLEHEDYDYDSVVGGPVTYSPMDDFDEDNIRTLCPGLLYVTDTEQIGTPSQPFEMLVIDNDYFDRKVGDDLKQAAYDAYQDSV